LHSRSDKLLAFLDRSGPDLYTLLTRLTLNTQTAEDLMQELFIKLNNSATFEKASSQKAFARRTAINLAFDWRRKNKRKLQSIDYAQNLVSDNNSPLDKLVRAEELQEILNAVGRLKGISREAFVMRYIQQASYQQIAKALTRSEHQVRALCSRAMERIRKIVGSNKSLDFAKGAKND